MKKIFRSASVILGMLALPLFSWSQTNIEGYEYWFDQNYAGHVDVPLTPAPVQTINTNIPAAFLSEGLHTLHLRFVDDNGKYSSVVSRFVIKAGSTASVTNNIDAWEYWFDQDFAGAVTTGITPAQVFNLSTAVDASALSTGLHTLHFRFRDEQGQWSSVVSRFIIKAGAAGTPGTNHVSSWQYWFDHDYASATTTPVTPTQVFDLSTAIDASMLSNGLHTIHLRFQDEQGQWSSVVSRFIIKNTSGTTVSSEIANYQYWFDQDYASAVTTPVTPSAVYNLNQDIDASTLSNGLHTLHIRFQDTRDQWSSVVSRFIIKNTASPVVNNLITSYRYWFDEGDTAMTTQNLATPIQVYNLSASVSLAHLPKGDHLIHFQFKDTLQQWSSVLTDTINKLPLPVALFEGDSLMFCDTGTVQFTDQSIDAETWLWTFGDGNSSTDPNPQHTYVAPGVYDVSLQVTDIGSGLDSTLNLTAYVGIYQTPDATISLSANDSICEGQTVDLSVIPGSNVMWNTGESTDLITTDTSGAYIVVMTHPMLPACEATDTAEITVIPVPMVNLGADTSICDGESLVLNANAGNSWLWNTSETTQNITVTGGGTYSVSAYNVLGCAGTDDITVTIDPLAVADFNFTVNSTVVDFADASTDVDTWSWDFDDGGNSTLQDPQNTYAANGTYQVCLTVTNQCNSDTYCQDVTITAVGTEETIETPVAAIYPNPANDITTLFLSGGNQREMNYRLLDLNGREVQQGTVQMGAANPLSVAHLEDGQYILLIDGMDYFMTLQLVVAR